jgi:hypothetical protein
MTSKRVAVGIACALLLAAGCSSAPPAAPESETPVTTASETPVTTASETQHVVAGPVGLDAPASWHVRPVPPNPSGNVTFAYLSPVELPSNCEATGQGGVCHPWPVVQLVPGGIVVAVRKYGMPGSQPPAGGDQITVGGLPARRISGSADEACRAIGGSELIDIVLPSVAGTTGWIALDACVAGGDVAAADAAFDAILAWVTIPGDAASP